MQRIFSRWIFKLLLMATVAGLLWLALTTWWDGRYAPINWFKPAPVKIDETPLVISTIRQIAELQTARMYAEIVVDSIAEDGQTKAIRTLSRQVLPPGLSHMLVPPSKKLILVVKGEVIAGIDFNGLTTPNIRSNKDSVWVTLPPVQVLDVITNPSDFEVFSEEGTWTSPEVSAVKEKARKKLEQAAQNSGLLVQAAQKAVTLMESFLKNAGYRYVSVKINPDKG